MIRFNDDELAPETVKQAAPFVFRFIPEILAFPLYDAVTLPKIVTFGVAPLVSYAQILTPATMVGFSVYIPSVTKMVSPLDAEAKAALIV